MSVICAKVRSKELVKYKWLLSTDEVLYDNGKIQIFSSTPYSAGAALEDGDWFSINNFSTQSYCIDIISDGYNSTDFPTMSKEEMVNIEYIFTTVEEKILFQKVPKSVLKAKKRVAFFGQGFIIEPELSEFVINERPDCIYDKKKDMLFFKKLETITSIFKGIDQLYRTATEQETREFLDSDFIELANGFSESIVSVANRKRISLAINTLESLDKNSKKRIVGYVSSYCPNLERKEDSFVIGNDEDLKMLLYGIEQRFYTTEVSGEKRIANSIVVI